MATLTQTRGRAGGRPTRKATHAKLNEEAASEFPPELQYAIDHKEQDYMGYNGCETLTVYNKSDKISAQESKEQQQHKHLGHNLDYAHRIKLQNDLKVRLFLIKKEYDLIPPMESLEEYGLSEANEMSEVNDEKPKEEDDAVLDTLCQVNEEEHSERTREEVEEEEEQRRLAQEKAEEEEQLKLENEKAEQERLRRLREEEEAEQARLRAEFEKETQILQSCNRTETELSKVEETLDSCIRSLLSTNETSYFVSYLDGTRRHNLKELDLYNTNTLDKIREALKAKDESTSALAGDEVVAQFNTQTLHEYVNNYTNALKKLFEYRTKHSETQVNDNKTGEETKDEDQANNNNEEAEAEAACNNDGEAELTKEVDETYASLLQVQEKYNSEATENYKKILMAIYA